jgi:H+/Cl- antiporter ClcA
VADSEAHTTLQDTIEDHASRGFTVSSQTETTAQMVRSKEFNLVPALLWFLLFGIGVLVYVFYYMYKRDETIFIRVQGGEVSVQSTDKSKGRRNQTSPMSCVITILIVIGAFIGMAIIAVLLATWLIPTG